MQETIINGLRRNDAASPLLAVLDEFYASFNARDAEGSIANWARQKDVIMCNPIGGIRHGWEAIYEGYQRIMQGATHVYVAFYDYHLVESSDMFLAVGRERGYAKKISINKDQRIELVIRTSRIFRRIQDKWQQVHHHGSIDDPDLLKQYQNFIKGE